MTDLRYSITQQQPYATPFFANRPGLRPLANASSDFDTDLEPLLRVTPTSQAVHLLPILCLGTLYNSLALVAR
jgi:hypothetical protein